MWGNSSKNLSHTQKFACSYTYAVFYTRRQGNMKSLMKKILHMTVTELSCCMFIHHKQKYIINVIVARQCLWPNCQKKTYLKLDCFLAKV